MIIRILKGIYMCLMFGAYGAGILFTFIFVFPVVIVIDKIHGQNPVRMQKVFSFFFSIWLFFMKAGGLLKSQPYTGKPYDGPCVIIANHPGLFDVLFLIRDIPKLAVLVKRSLALKLPIGSLLKSAGYVLSPDNRSISPVESLQNAMEKIQMGYKFQLFPEGTRSPVGKLLPFSAGAIKIAQKLNIPIQPVFIYNEPPFLPKGAPWYLPPKKISVFKMEFWDIIPAPEKKDIKKVANALQERFNKALTDSRNS